MDYTFKELRSYYVLILMLLYIHLMPVFPVPVRTCHNDLNQTYDLTSLLESEANKLLVEYVEFHESRFGSVPKDVPDSKVSGDTISKKLQNIYFKNELFYLHISKVEEYQNKSQSVPQSFKSLLHHFKLRLKHLSAKIKALFLKKDPETTVPTMPAPPQLSHTYDFEKIEYGWGVIFRLKDWFKQVREELRVEEVCSKQTAEAL